ncbi:hypothetical protein M9H77_09255 [Catharanthus roseus]|uniref:Uncharacterized protein n=1 Tax=Catharanthus roseus TaxID=4058 RepID=A0ACC0C054_CATRO|nr:hypothetical protein M9H77_09255 [Catharanthus roseus]
MTDFQTPNQLARPGTYGESELESQGKHKGKRKYLKGPKKRVVKPCRCSERWENGLNTIFLFHAHTSSSLPPFDLPPTCACFFIAPTIGSNLGGRAQFDFTITFGKPRCLANSITFQMAINSACPPPEIPIKFTAITAIISPASSLA